MSAPKRLVFAAGRGAGLDRAARFINRRRLLVLCYHGLRTDDDPTRHWLLVARSEFARQLRFLVDHYRCVSIDEGLAALRAGSLREPTACVTFDDGYRSNLTVALPLLREHGVPATVYLATGLIDSGALLWTMQIELTLRAATVPSVDLSELGLGVRALGDSAERARVARAVIEALKFRPDAERLGWVNELPEVAGVRAPVDGRAFALMSWDEVREMAGSGLVTFGGHTVRHGILSRLPDADVEEEVAGSVRAVASHTSAVSRTFAYPNGRPIDFDGRAVEAARRAGVVAALSTIEGLNAPETDPYALRRVSVGGDATSFDDFRLRTAGVIAMLNRARRPLSRGAGAPAPAAPAAS